MDTQIFNVTFAGEDLTETVMVEAANREEAGDAAEYELVHHHPEISSLTDSGLTIRDVEVINPFSPAARAFRESRDVADYWDMVSNLRNGG